MPSGNSGNSPPDNRARERHVNERDVDNTEKLNIELQRLREIADRMDRDRRRGALGGLGLNWMARSTIAGMLFMIIIMLTVHGFIRIFEGMYAAFF